MKKLSSFLVFFILLTGASVVLAADPEIFYVDDYVNAGNCDLVAGYYWLQTDEVQGWKRFMAIFNQTPFPCENHPIWRYLSLRKAPGWIGNAGEVANDYYFSCLTKKCSYNNGLEIAVEQKNDSTKDNCTVAGMILWNPFSKKWEGRVNYYNNTPIPCSTHSAFAYVNSIVLPNRQGNSDWETIGWKKFGCLDGCEGQPIVMKYSATGLLNNETVAGFMMKIPDYGWQRYILMFNGAPKPCDNHPVWNYVWSLNPNHTGTDWEIWGDSYFSSYEGCSNGLEMTDIETVHISDSGKGDCYVSASFTWNPNKNSWIPQVKYYNNTPVPCKEHSAYVYIRTLPVPNQPGTTPWETKGWKSFNCNCIDY